MGSRACRFIHTFISSGKWGLEVRETVSYFHFEGEKSRNKKGARAQRARAFFSAASSTEATEKEKKFKKSPTSFVDELRRLRRTSTLNIRVLLFWVDF